jgi:hypothetical protein
VSYRETGDGRVIRLGSVRRLIHRSVAWVAIGACTVVNLAPCNQTLLAYHRPGN